MIRVQTGSRLHFGLLNPAHIDTLSDDVSIPRCFGGVGLMVEAPSINLSMKPAAAWSADGPLANRALAFAKHFTESLPDQVFTPQHITIERGAPRDHCGFGTGTQLGLAVGKALVLSAGFDGFTALEIAKRVGRGHRSGLGVHGFDRGGFLVEGGKRSDESISPLVFQKRFPDDWRIVLVHPIHELTMYGQAEARAFQNVQLQPPQVDTLCRLILLGLLPALIEQDLEAFGASLHEYNTRAGDAFASVQGGQYAHPKIAEAIQFIRDQGVEAAGQSSWGPTVFAIAADEDRAEHLAQSYRRHFHLNGEDVIITRARNSGALALRLQK